MNSLNENKFVYLVSITLDCFIPPPATLCSQLKPAAIRKYRNDGKGDLMCITDKFCLPAIITGLAQTVFRQSQYE